MSFFVISMMAIGVLFYFVVEDYLEDQARAFVETLMLEMTTFVEERGVEALVEEIDERAKLDLYSREIFVLFDENHEAIAGAPRRLPPEMLRPEFREGLNTSGGKVFADLPNRFPRGGRHTDPSNGREDEALFLIEELPGGWSLLIVMAVPEIEETREFVGRTLAASFVVLTALGLLGAVLLTRVVERKLERLNVLSHEIREGDLTLRIPTDGTGDEFDNLAANLNAMLDRIAALLESSRQVTNDIAHDLRTPLTRMQTRLETLKEDPRAATGETIDAILEDSQAMLRLFDALLRISGIESGGADLPFTEVSLSEIVEDVVELYEPLATEKGLTCLREVEPNLEVSGDRDLLFQAIANIVENAIKYTPAETPRGHARQQGTVEVELKPTEGGIRLLVKDSGPGIPAEKREKVFDRFYRLESHRGSPGNGLGLSLVKAIADLHRAQIELHSDSDGLTFSLVFSGRQK